MPTYSPRYLFEPASVALIGASERPGSPGAALTRGPLSGGFKGDLCLVNRRHWRSQGISAFQVFIRTAALPGSCGDRRRRWFEQYRRGGGAVFRHGYLPP
ncbi:MAG: hypothetical protein P9E24_06435 [Candidatus Competibacter sp.]|nr:hypothetical protein [Candidatus Competibacter sp.]MDG4585018.1 hypothetical protein [Candidatus Competibacter sp.]